MSEPSQARPPIKILVLYDSQTGNVEHMARLVTEGAREIQGVEVRIKKIGGEGNSVPLQTTCSGPRESP